MVLIPAEPLYRCITVVSECMDYSCLFYYPVAIPHVHVTHSMVIVIVCIHYWHTC